MALRCVSAVTLPDELGGMDAADCILAGAMDGALVVYADDATMGR